MFTNDEGEAFEGAVGVKETDRALLVRFDDGVERWVPKSCIHDDSEVYAEDDEGRLAVKRWWAEREGLA